MPVGMSCGGMQAVYFATKYPQYVSAIYLDAPVLNLLSCPCGVGVATNKLYEEFVGAMGITASDLINYRNHPIDNAHKLIESRIPVFLICGGVDSVVPYVENGKILSEMYRKSDVPFFEIVKPDCDHHPHGLDDNTVLIEFAERYYN
jgi:pimeloyl-ACP methyl ester carboxylesterase